MNVINKPPKSLSGVFEANSPETSLAEQVHITQEILEHLPDGFLIVSEEGVILQSNHLGRHLCEQLIDGPISIDSVPKRVWQLCESLLDSHISLANHPHDYLLIEEDVQTMRGASVRVRAQFLTQDLADLTMLVILEDRFQTAHARAIAEGHRYGLTNREAEIWKYRCIGCTYKDISQKLFITIDTVKKHVKSIYAKRETFQLLQHEK